MDDDDDSNFDTFSDDDATIPCPHCGAEIYDDAERCPECGAYLSREDAPASSQPWWIVIGVLVCLAIAIWWAIAG